MDKGLGEGPGLTDVDLGVSCSMDQKKTVVSQGRGDPGNEHIHVDTKRSSQISDNDKLSSESPSPKPSPRKSKSKSKKVQESPSKSKD
mgnify:CR=1 FL=1